MVPQYNKIHNKFRLNNSTYLFEELKEVAYSHIKEGLPFEKTIGNFLIDWLDAKDYVIVNTSGSTGKPKPIRLSKQAMVHSAIATGDFFNLQPGDKALHCLPSNFIAGKMMLVRAMVLGLELDLTEPTSRPVFDYEVPYKFCAMLPMQLHKTMSYIQNIEQLIVGGAAVSGPLKASVQGLQTTIYETYGMTETITHIAVKQINNSGNAEVNHFKTLPNVTVSKDSRNCLIINAPNILEENIVTNDVVNIHSKTEFEWLGRYDNIINSGGLKINPEQIEEQLKSSIKERFFIASEKNETLGEQLILIIEADEVTITPSAFKNLNKLMKPKQTYAISKFVETPSGKINRKKTLKLLNKL
ncbi:AMP-binding protein [Lacinutrix salivirga]